jgi:molybdopterin converting factor small subunit
MIRVQLPPHLRNLAGTGKEVELDVAAPITLASVVGALEAAYPNLRGAIRDHGTLKRRAMVRYFACEQDLSHQPDDTPVPDEVVSGKEPFIILGAISGGSH